MKRIKVLHLQPEYNVKPFDVSDLEEQINKAFPVERFEVVNCFLMKRSETDIHESRAERTVYLNLQHRDFRGLRLKMIWAVWQLLRRETFDVVLCHRYKPSSVMMHLQRWVNNPQCISVIHSFSDYKPRSRRKLLSKLETSDKWHFITVSEPLRQHLLGLQTGFTEDNTTSITNAIDVVKARQIQLSRGKARQVLGLPERARIIGTVGRLVSVKGHRYLIEAFAKVQPEFPGIILVIIGEGEERSSLEQLIDHYQLVDKVYLLGAVEGAVCYVRAFDIWTMPSLSEGLGLALLEGMSGKLPCIGSDIPALKPLLNGAGGESCPPADADALAECLARYLAMTDEQLDCKGQLAYEYIIRHHSITDFRNAYLQLVEKIAC
ncbi:MAG: glycosyltransferase [Methylophaga sp.]|nr:glycosyltransferase [Methylophaga sp.]